jgi:hypothetical protein
VGFGNGGLGHEARASDGIAGCDIIERNCHSIDRVESEYWNVSVRHGCAPGAGLWSMGHG